jgi:hypothetical protein
MPAYRFASKVKVSKFLAASAFGIDLTKIPQGHRMLLFGFDLSLLAAGQAEVTIGEIIAEIIHLAVLETTVLIHQFGVLGLALIVVSLSDKM